MLTDRQRKKMLANEEKRAETCNFQVGDIVDYHSVIGGEITSSGHTIRHMLTIPSNKRRIAWLTNIVGCVAIAALTRGHNDDLR